MCVCAYAYAYAYVYVYATELCWCNILVGQLPSENILSYIMYNINRLGGFSE